jgi:hypothetical protein
LANKIKLVSWSFQDGFDFKSGNPLSKAIALNLAVASLSLMLVHPAIRVGAFLQSLKAIFGESSFKSLLKKILLTFLKENSVDFETINCILKEIDDLDMKNL